MAGIRDPEGAHLRGPSPEREGLAAPGFLEGSPLTNNKREIRPGDLCRLVGTRGWGDLCVVIKTNSNGFGGVEVLRQDGLIAIIGPAFLSNEDL